MVQSSCKGAEAEFDMSRCLLIHHGLTIGLGGKVGVGVILLRGLRGWEGRWRPMRVEVVILM